MSHVDEGTLHAYLDGELPSAERAALEAHLAECGTCRANLAEARALLERASALLGSARPVERPAPPFEQLRRGSNRSPWRVRRSFAWAASIALALGIGYSLRNPAAPLAPASLETQRVDLSQKRAVSTQEEKTPAPPSARQESRGRRTARADEMAQGADSAVAATAAAPRFADSISVDAAKVSGALARAEQARPAARVANIHVDGVPLPQFAATTWPVISRPVAKTILGEEPVGLPGLETRSFRRAPGTDGTVVVEQALDSSTVIQIFQRPAGSTYPYDTSGSGYANEGRARPRGYASEDQARERGNRLFARFVKGLRVEIKGPLSADSLNRLLEQVAPLP